LIEDFINQLKDNDSYKDQIIFRRTIEAKKPKYGQLAVELDSRITKWLDNNKLNLYTHQTDALNSIFKGKHTVITTATASGKTLIFSLATAQAFVLKKGATALFLYPMKALANDQLAKLSSLNTALDGLLKPFIYDGDTPTENRPFIRENARIVISNPYAFHRYLNWHPKWENFFRNLRFIIIDEAHMYRGVFGSNVAQLIRRILRITKYYNASPQFILSSATINNPDSFIEKLISLPVDIIANDGSASGSKELIIWNPPFIDEFQLKRRSSHQETREVLFQSIIAQFQTLCFTQSRKMAEIITLWIKQDLKNHMFDEHKIMAYRAGYHPSERRDIERKLRDRSISAVVSTNALEVGIDIGNLTTVILSGFPGTIISTWQQIGRVGRTEEESLAVLVLFEDAYQQFLGRNPEYFMRKSPENAIIDLTNPYILKGHILCAAAELPIKQSEIQTIWGKMGSHVIKELVTEEKLKISMNGIVLKGIQNPSSQISLNSAFSETIDIFVGRKHLETVTISQAYREAHEGAILIHQGESYYVNNLNLRTKRATTRWIRVNYYTDTLSISDVEILSTEEKVNCGYNLEYGKVRTTEIYHSYRKKSYDEILEIKPLDLPPLEFTTKAVWIEIPEELVHDILAQGMDLAGGLHALEHATIALSPLFAMCDRWDIGGTSYPVFPQDGSAKIFIYDGFPGGIGIAEQLFQQWGSLLKNVRSLIQSCSCSSGCPSCIQSPKCGNDNYPLDKQVALYLLDNLITLSDTQNRN
jgi:DEAD/DEAH box helicase domain-containing protein